MLFNSSHSWWGTGRPRPYTHEGVDLCFFESETGNRYRLDDSTRVPMAATGRILAIIDDFIGKTIVCDYFCGLETSRPAYVLYAHIRPEQGLRIGDAVEVGECIARIAPVDPKKSPLPPHLHLSLVLQEALPLPGFFDWRYLNRLSRDAFIDPAIQCGLFERNMDIIVFDPATNTFDGFLPCPGGSLTKTP